MKAIKFDKPGGSDVLYLDDIAIPEIADNQVLLKNHAIGINRIWLSAISGISMSSRYKTSDPPGLSNLTAFMTI